MYKICFYVFMFLIFSIFGWITECIACSIGRQKFVYDRGFLVGPYCPVYGFGILFMYLFLSIYSKSPIVVFFIAFIGASVIEYFASFLMEKLFKARWWDYSNNFLNINGRVCLKNSLGFGILGIAFTYYAKPFYISMVNKIPHNILIVATILLSLVFLVDNIVSFTIMCKIKHKFSNIRKDSTSDIDKEVRDILNSYTFYFKKLFKSFPNFKLSFPSGEKIVTAVNNSLDSFDELRKERKRKIKEIKKSYRKRSNK